MRSFPIWTIIIFAIPALMAGCLRRAGSGSDMPAITEVKKDPLVARVGKSVLRESDINGIYGEALSAEDSVKLLEGYVNTWVRKQLKVQEAERILESSGVDIEAMINDYRNSLLTYRLDQYYVDHQMDTVVPASQVEEYYLQHQSEFTLDRTIVKGRVVRVPASYRQQAKLKELMGSANAARQQDFLDICLKNNFQLTEFESWVDFREFLTYLPTTRGKSYDYLTAKKTVQEMSDADNKYYVQISESMKKGDKAPLEWVEHIVRRIIYNQRRNDVIKRSEDSLYNAALGSDRVYINID